MTATLVYSSGYSVRFSQSIFQCRHPADRRCRARGQRKRGTGRPAPGYRIHKNRGHITQAVALVDAQNHRLAAFLQHMGNVGVIGGHTAFQVHHKDDHIGGVNGDLCLHPHFGKHHIIGLRLNAAGIHQHKFPSAPFAGGVNAVTGHTGVSSTMESRCPVSLLNSVDLPTFGRPTMAISGLDISGHFLSVGISKNHILPAAGQAFYKAK